MQWFYWLLAFLLSAGAGYWVYLSDKRRAVPYPWVTSVLRGLVIFFTVLLILVPAITITKNAEEKPVVLFLQDNSVSVGATLGSDSVQYRKDAEQLLQKLSAKYTVVRWGFGADAQQDSGYHYNQPVTDISAAMARVQEYYGLQNLGAVVLASDGRYNQGMNPALQQLALHSAVYGICIGDTAAQKDLAVSGLYANKIVSLNSSFEIRADILAKLCNGYNNTVQLAEGGQVLGTSPLVVTADKFDRATSFTVKADKAGLHHYVVSTAAAEGEKSVANNRRDIFVEVLEQKKNILIASAAPHPDINAIKDALAGVESYNIFTCTADNFPANIAQYDAIVLHGLPSSHNDISRQVLAAKKPVWLILTGQSNLAAVNSMRDLTFTAITNGPARDVVPAYNPSFNTFLLPRQMQVVADKMPPLTVSSGNVQSAPGNNALFLQKNIADGRDAPLWMMQQGAAPVAILAGEGIWRWRLYEFKNFGEHTVVDECIRQTVAYLCSGAREKQFSVAMPKYVWRDQEPVSLSAHLLNANNEQVNTPDATLAVTDSAGNKKDYTLEKRGTAYALNLGVWAGGTYTYKAHTVYNGKDLYATGSFAVESIPVELMEQGADYGLMYGVARKYNGAVLQRKDIGAVYDSIMHNTSIKPLLSTTTESVPFIDRKWYFFIILLIAVAEWLLRKYWLAQ